MDKGHVECGIKRNCFFLLRFRPEQKAFSVEKLTDLENSSAPYTFADLSELLLGQRQEAQYQSGDQKSSAYRWGSLKNESGEILGITGLGDDGKPLNKSGTSVSKSGGVWVENNSRAAIPRAYYGEPDANFPGNSVFFNYYASVAESVSWNDTYVVAPTDSICPAGWQLPINGNNNDTTNKSYRKLLFGAYGLSDDSSESGDSTSTKTLRKLPLSFTFSGFYSWASGDIGNIGSNGFYLTSSTASSTGARNLFIASNGRLVPQDYSHYRLNGFSVRCVMK